jgi:hypothetical protein
MKALMGCLALALALTLACVGTINTSINLPPGSRDSGAQRSVNGNIRLGQGGSAGALSTVNGSIIVESDGVIDGDLLSVNGNVACDPRTRVTGSVRTVNGRIELSQTQVMGDVSTYFGDIDLAGARIAGDLVILKPDHRGDGSRGRTTLIRLSQGTEIRGRIRIEDENHVAEVTMSPDCKVVGGLGRAKVLSSAE